MDAIVAVYGDWGIGKDGTQPIALSADRKYFRQMTKGAQVIVGRKTLADFPGGQPLPKREHLVLSRQDVEIPGVQVVHSAEEAKNLEKSPCFVIGGAQVYKTMLPYCQRVYVTKLAVTPKSDAWFPNLDADPAWTCAEEGPELWENGIAYRFCCYQRT